MTGSCIVCGHDPACGYASIFHDGKEDWYCHDDDHSCYEGRGNPSESVAAQVLGSDEWTSPDGSAGVERP